MAHVWVIEQDVSSPAAWKRSPPDWSPIWRALYFSRAEAVKAIDKNSLDRFRVVKYVRATK